MNTLPFPRFVLISFIVLGLCASLARANYDFCPWANGLSPEEVGKRVTERFLQRDYRLLGAGVVHYVRCSTTLSRTATSAKCAKAPTRKTNANTISIGCASWAISSGRPRSYGVRRPFSDSSSQS
jgi:hypothetical protein